MVSLTLGWIEILIVKGVEQLPGTSITFARVFAISGGSNGVYTVRPNASSSREADL